MNVYKDIECTQEDIAYIGTDVRAQSYAYLRCDKQWYEDNKCNSKNVAFIPIFSFSSETVSTSVFKPHINKVHYNVEIVPRFIFNQCIPSAKWLNTKDYIELSEYTYDNEFMVNGYYMNPCCEQSLSRIIHYLHFDNQILNILKDNKCGWLFTNSVLPCKSEYVDLDEAYERSKALDILNQLNDDS